MQKVKKGFTLIELMVVVMIIGLLSGAVIVNVNKARQDSRDAKRISDLSMVSSALQQYYTDKRAFPATSGAMDSQFASMMTTLRGIYIASSPTDPLNGNASNCGTGINYAYRYNYISDSTSADYGNYYLFAQTENPVTQGVKWTRSGGTPCDAYVLKNGEVYQTDITF